MPQLHPSVTRHIIWREFHAAWCRKWPSGVLAATETTALPTTLHGASTLLNLLLAFAF